jgi:hypothetical protein
MAAHLQAFPEANPWHVCFAVGLAWGHLAKLEIEFTEAAIGALSDLNDSDLRSAASFHMERGPEPIVQSLSGAFTLFSRVVLPKELPDSLERISRAEERWIGSIVNDRPRYIGSWNATAMFMSALFAQPTLAATQTQMGPVLPPGGPIVAGLKLLYDTSILIRPPSGSVLDDEAFEPGIIYENNALLVELLKSLDGWSMIDAHTGVYMLGTRDQRSGAWG